MPVLPPVWQQVELNCPSFTRTTVSFFFFRVVHLNDARYTHIQLYGTILHVLLHILSCRSTHRLTAICY